MKKLFWESKPWQAFKSFAILFSFIVNFILVVVLVVAAPLILPILNDIVEPIVGGLNQSFVEMGEADIVRTIDVNDNLGINFDLPLDQETVVVLTADVELNNLPLVVDLGSGNTLSGRVDIVLPEGTNLPVALNLVVPVSQTIPVELAVDVHIPLDETDLGHPFYTLQSLFGPLDQLVRGLPSTNAELFQRILGSANERTPAVLEELPAE